MWQKSEKATLFILTPLAISIALSMDIYVPSLLNIMQAFSVNEAMVQWTLSIFMFGVGIAQLFCGPLTDHFGRKKVAFGGLSIYLIGTLICMLATSIQMLIVGRLLQSFGSCMTLVISYAVVKDVYSVQKSARIYSYLGSMIMLAPLLAPLLGGYLSIWFGSWRANFVFLFLFALVSFVTTSYFLTETLPPEQRVKIKAHTIAANYIRVLRSRAFLLHTFYALTGMTILFGFCGVSSFLLINVLHLSKQYYGLCFGANSLVFMLMTATCVRVMDRLGMQNSILLGLSLLMSGSAIMLVVNGYAGLSALHFMLPMFVITSGLGFMMGPSTAGALAEFSGMAGTASALYSSAQFLSAGVLGSMLLKNPVNTAIPFASLILIMSVVALSLYTWNRIGNLVTT